MAEPGTVAAYDLDHPNQMHRAVAAFVAEGVGFGLAAGAWRAGDAVAAGRSGHAVRSAGGDARTLYRSIQKILSLPDATRVFVGHDYLPEDGRADFRWETTVGEEKAANIHIAGRTEDDFVALREARDATLKAPQLILPALQVNIRAGALPPAEPSGKRFLKLPLNAT